MLKKMILAGLMSATVIGGISPAYAQRGDGGGWRVRGDQAGRQDGGGGTRSRGYDGGQRWQRSGDARQDADQRRADQAVARPVQPRADRQWQDRRQGGDDGIRSRTRADGRVFEQQTGTEQPQRRDDGQAQVGQDWRGNRGDWRRDDRRDDRRDNRWSNDDRRWSNDDRRWNGKVVTGRRFDDRTRWTGQRRWSNDWRRDDRYDWYSYRSRYGDRYRLGRYYAPRGWNYGYSRFSVGIILNSLLFNQSYWINDPWSYRLPPAYGTLRWVRYYDDALLVDIRDGYVVDVIHDFFW